MGDAKGTPQPLITEEGRAATFAGNARVEEAAGGSPAGQTPDRGDRVRAMPENAVAAEGSKHDSLEGTVISEVCCPGATA
jgi:hypothetical protein